MNTDYCAALLVIEEVAAGIGGLLESWPCAPAFTEKRLTYLHSRLEEVRSPLSVDRVVNDLTGPAPVLYVDKRTRHDQPSEVRAWALEQGIPVQPRGRIPTAVYQAYERRSA